MRRRSLLGDAGRRARRGPSSTAGSSRVFCCVPLAVPALQLAGDVALVPAEVGEADGVEVDGVDGGQRVDERLARRCGAPSASSVGSGAVAVAEHVAVDEAHHVERRAVDRRVVAEPERRRDRHRRCLQAGDDPVLAAHVVGAGEHVAERRPAQHEARAVGAGDAVGEVGVTAGDERRT